MTSSLTFRANIPAIASKSTIKALPSFAVYASFRTHERIAIAARETSINCGKVLCI